LFVEKFTNKFSLALNLSVRMRKKDIRLQMECFLNVRATLEPAQNRPNNGTDKKYTQDDQLAISLVCCLTYLSWEANYCRAFLFNVSHSLLEQTES
jgi:hypothetical protein